MAREITITMRIDLDAGVIEDFVVDDNDRSASEQSHDETARNVAGLLVSEDLIGLAEVPPLAASPSPERNDTSRTGTGLEA